MPGKIKTKQINHVTTMVKDTARAMKFYNDLLGINHAFEVEDFEGTMKILEENGYEIMRHGVRFDGQAFLFTHDPDGNRVEFCTGSGYFPAPGRPA